MIDTRKSEIPRNRQSVRLLSHSKEPIEISSLEQLAFIESAKRHNLLQENRYLFDLWCDEENDESNTVIKMARAVLKEFPSASVILDAHGSRRVRDVDERRQVATSRHGGKLIFKKIRYGPNSNFKSCREGNESKEEYWDGQVFLRPWGIKVANVARTSNHPFHKEAMNDKGWVEIFLRMENNGKTLELPPRPDFYGDLAAPRRIRYTQF